jgi:hypothetical protein
MEGKHIEIEVSGTEKVSWLETEIIIPNIRMKNNKNTGD